MTADDILKIFDAIPNYIIYIYPGYIAQYVYFYLKGKNLPDTKITFIKSVGFSYLIITIAKLKVNFENGHGILENIAYILLASLGAWFFCEIMKKLDKWNEKSGKGAFFYDNEFDALSQYDKGAWIAVYLNNDDIVYEGKLALKSIDKNSDGRNYITLKEYEKYKVKAGSKYMIEDYSESKDYDAEVVIYYADIKRVEKFKDK